ncbi:MAG: hypothetical protein CVU63_25085 [Deltaproteobacteria bacterium HGW-Deltaproteobacteria-20]|nr:MAG: hypothetical protein CVU63_25085 [Deltaproteobacteria bacterium HGW-Deltaproteobacteria-20]
MTVRASSGGRLGPVHIRARGGPTTSTGTRTRNAEWVSERATTSLTDCGSNYEEARGAESPADFVHKTRIALKEVRETRYWLRLAAS